MIIEIRETVYKGFHINHAEEKGWMIVLEGEEILFPYLTAAQGAVDEFWAEVAPKYKGKLLRNGQVRRKGL